MSDGRSTIGTGRGVGSRRCAAARLFALACLAAAPALAAADEGAGGPGTQQDKSRFTLFNPTPRGLMRELTPDRPDRTESPFTVDAGHLQIELSFAEWRKGGGTEELSVLPTNVKLGLTNNVDLQFVFSPYLRARSPGRTDDGIGDSQVRLKVNLWGNDGGEGFFGQTALAVMPYVQLPTGADAFSNDDRVEGGVIVPLSVQLPAEFELTVMAEFDFVRDGGGGYDTLFVHSASISRDIAGPLGAYAEYVGVTTLDGGVDYQSNFGTGLTYKVNDDTQLDCGVEVGLTGDADDLRVFAGLTVRL